MRFVGSIWRFVVWVILWSRAGRRMARMTHAVATVSEVSKSYQFGDALVRALRGVSLKIYPGEFLAAAGPSGSGKSTLLNLVGCLDRPDTGTVMLGDVAVSRLPARALSPIRRDRLGFIFQTFNLVPVLTAFENVEYPALVKGVPARERAARVRELLDRVGLADKAARRPHELSGGERQRVAVARALVNRPALVLADEPTANLDSASGAAVLDLMHDLRTQYGVAFFFASHDSRLLARMDRIIALRDGELIETVSNHAPATPAAGDVSSAAHVPSGGDASLHTPALAN
jgi:putative ABC transport system ATP-binding protein